LNTALRLRLPVMMVATMLSMLFATGALAQVPPPPPPPPYGWLSCVQGGQQNCANLGNGSYSQFCQQLQSTTSCPGLTANGAPWWAYCQQGQTTANCPTTTATNGEPWWMYCQQNANTASCPNVTANGEPWWTSCQQNQGTTNCPTITTSSGGPWWTSCQQNTGPGNCPGGFAGGFVSCVLDNIPVLIPGGDSCSSINATST